jgi:hypothetical protein
MNVSPSDEAFV